MFNKILYSFILFSALAVSACSSEEDNGAAAESNKEHFASDQKNALDKAKGVEQLLQDGADNRALEIEGQTK